MRTPSNPERVARFLALLAKASRHEHEALSGSRNRWPRCSALTRGNPRRGRPGGRPCQAAGCGFNNKCFWHGGLLPGFPLGNPRRGSRARRKLVLFSGCVGSLVDELSDSHEQQRRWHLIAIPLDLFERLSPAIAASGYLEGGRVAQELVEAGVRRCVAARWPQKLGFRVIVHLLMRERIAFGLFGMPKDILRAARKRVGARDQGLVRVEPSELLRAMRAAGSRPAKRPLVAREQARGEA